MLAFKKMSATMAEDFNTMILRASVRNFKIRTCKYRPASRALQEMSATMAEEFL